MNVCNTNKIQINNKVNKKSKLYVIQRILYFKKMVQDAKTNQTTIENLM